MNLWYSSGIIERLMSSSWATPALLHETASTEGAFLRDRKNSSVPGWLQINSNAAALMMATLGALRGGGAGRGSEFWDAVLAFLSSSS